MRPVLRRSEAVNSRGIIGPIRIAEILGAVRKGVGLNGRPCGIRQISAGIDNHGHVRRPGDGETEAVGLHSKAGAVVKDNRARKHPLCSHQIAEGRAPAYVARQVIGIGGGGGIVGFSESSPAKAGRTALEITGVRSLKGQK